MKKSSNSPADQKRIGEHHQIDFGYEMIDEEQKADKVHEVFDSVAPKYDLMNDLLSFGSSGYRKRYRRFGARLCRASRKGVRYCVGY